MAWQIKLNLEGFFKYNQQEQSILKTVYLANQLLLHNYRYMAIIYGSWIQYLMVLKLISRIVSFSHKINKVRAN